MKEDRVHNTQLISVTCNSYTMGCPPVRRDNPQALASGLSCVQVDKHGITIYFITPTSLQTLHIMRYFY